METVEQVPLTVQTDPQHGGRWTSLRAGTREWLWLRDEPLRDHVAVGDDFADAGGLEECVPTVRGIPDHGDAWTRVWTAIDEHEHAVRCKEFELTRRISVDQGAIVADYRLAADPGYRFIWAAHALLDVSPRATLELDQDSKVRLFPEAAPHLADPWPDGAAWIEGDWPAPAGLRLDHLGPDDGSGVGAVAYRPEHDGRATVLVLDGPDQLRMTLVADAQPTAIALWRNLGGFPQPVLYRSIGVEPMLGRVFDLADAQDDDCAITPATGEVHWRLTIASFRRTDRS